MMSGLRIRDAARADTDALLEIYRPYVLDTAVSFELEPPTAAEFAQRIAGAQSQWAWLVAERDGELLGYAYGSAFRSRAAYRWSVETFARTAPPTISAVSAARTLGEVRITSASNPIEERCSPSRLACLRPLSLSGRAASGPVHASGSPASA